MVEHPWMRAPALANMLGLILASLGIVIGGLQIKEIFLKNIFIIIGIITFIVFTFLFSIFLALTIRDYRDLYPKFTRSILRIKY